MPLTEKQKRGYIGVCFTEEQKEIIRTKAKEEGRSISNLIMWELRHLWEENSEKSKPRIKRRKHNGKK